MATVVNIFQYVFPVLVVSIAVVLLCFYLHTKKKRAVYDVTTPPPPQEASTSPAEEAQADASGHQDRLPPRYSTVDHPPPYSLFDPKLTSVWPGGSPPAYEMYPIMLPLAPHHWLSPTGPLYPTPSPSPAPPGRPQPQRSLPTSPD